MGFDFADITQPPALRFRMKVEKKKFDDVLAKLLKAKPELAITSERASTSV
jgi:hypothetical protein